jgi:phage-related holin
MNTFTAIATDTVAALGSKWYVKGALAALAFLFGTDSVVHHMLLALAVLMAVDLIVGVWRAGKAKQLSSTIGVKATAAKFGVYALVVISARMLGIIVGSTIGAEDLRPMVSAALVYLAAQEAISIDDNLRAISGVGLGQILAKVLKAAGVGQAGQ